MISLLTIPASNNGVKNFLSTLLTVIDTEAYFHGFIRLEVSVGQLLEEVENDVLVII